LVDAADSKPACRQAGLPPAMVYRFDSDPGHGKTVIIWQSFFVLGYLFYVYAQKNLIWLAQISCTNFNFFH